MNSSLRERLLRLAEVERELSRELGDTASRSRSLIVKAALTALSMDSAKHAAIFELLAQHVGEAPDLSEAEGLLDAVKYHVEKEEGSVNEMRAMAEEGWFSENPYARLLLMLIFHDEALHHIVLNDLLGALLRGGASGHEFDDLLIQLTRFLEGQGL